MVDGRVVIVVTAQDEASAVADEVEKKFSGMDGQIGKSSGGFLKFGAVAGAAGALASKGVDLIIGQIGGMLSALSQSSATWQTFNGNMEMLGKSSKQIAAIKKELQDYATQTIYSASDMSSTYAQLAAVGTKNTTKLVKGFGGLAAAADDPTQAMKTLSQQATQMAGKPTVAWEDFKLMLEQTPAGMAAVAKSMGMSTSELIKNIQAGKVSTQDFFNAIATTGTNANFTKMATQYKTVGQAADGLTETLTNKLQPGFDQLSKVGIQAISGLVDWIGTVNFQPMFDGLMAGVNFMTNIVGPALVSGFKTALPVIKSTISVISGVLKTLFTFVNSNKGWLGPLVAGIGTFVVSFMAINKAVTVAKTAITGFRTALNVGQALVGIARGSQAAGSALSMMAQSGGIAAKAQALLNAVMAIDPFVLIVAAIAAVVVALTWFFTQTTTGRAMWQSFMSWLKSAWQGISSFFSGLWQGIVNVFNTAVQAVGQFLSSGVGQWLLFVTVPFLGIINFFIQNWEMIKTVFFAALTAIGTFFTTAWSAITTTIQTVWNGIVAFLTGVVQLVVNAILIPIGLLILAWQAFWNAFGGYITPIWDAIVSFVTGAINAVMNVISAVLTTISSVWNSIWGAISGFVSSIWSEIESIISSAINAVSGVVSSVMSIISGIWSSIWNAISGVASSVWGAIRSTVSSAIGAVSSVVSGGISAVQGDFNRIGSIVGVVAGAMGSVVSAVSGGISSAYSAVSGWVGNMVSAGRNFVMGFVNGITGAIGSAVSAAANLAKKALGAAKSALGIHSPSRMMAEVGMFTAVGMANGISDNAKTVTKNMTSMAQGAIDAVKNADISGSVNKAFNTSPQLANLLNGHVTAEGVINANTAKMGGTSTNVSNANRSVVVNNNFNGDMSIRDENDIQSLSEKLAAQQQINLRGAW